MLIKSNAADPADASLDARSPLVGLRYMGAVVLVACGIVLVALLLSLDTLPEDSHHQGEFYALIVFGAVGMCLLTGAVELLVVLIALEISSISTYVLAGYRKQTGRGPEAEMGRLPSEMLLAQHIDEG